MGYLNIVLLGLLFLFIISMLYGAYRSDEFEIAINLNLMGTPYYKIGLFSGRTIISVVDEPPFIQDEVVIGLLILEVEFIFYKDLEA